MSRAERAVVNPGDEVTRQARLSMQGAQPPSQDGPNRIGVPANRNGFGKGEHRVVAKAQEAKRRKGHGVHDEACRPDRSRRTGRVDSTGGSKSSPGRSHPRARRVRRFFALAIGSQPARFPVRRPASDLGDVAPQYSAPWSRKQTETGGRIVLHKAADGPGQRSDFEVLRSDGALAGSAHT